MLFSESLTIKDHLFEFPDICDFPGAGISLYESSSENENIIENIEKAFQSYNSELYNRCYDHLIKNCVQKNPLTGQQYNILENQTKRVKNSVQLYFNSCRNQNNIDNIDSNEIYKSLLYEGYYDFNTETEEIKDLLQKDIEDLYSIKNSDYKIGSYDRFKFYRVNDNKRLFDLVTKIFNYKNAWAGMNKFNSKNLNLFSITLHLSKPGDRHHDHTLMDMETTSSLTSLHMDPKYNIMKAILYLTDVDEDSGPFTVVPKSHRWNYNPIERTSAQGNSIGNYLNSDDHRKVMRILPKIFRKNAICGRYFLDGTKINKWITNQLKTFTSNNSNCIIFYPSLLLHRGGLCKSKERINLQILMR